MRISEQISGLAELAKMLNDFVNKTTELSSGENDDLLQILKKSQMENSWFTMESQLFALKQWSDVLNEENLEQWVQHYRIAKIQKRVGLILAGNIPMVGFHDVIAVVLSGNIPLIKLSSKDRHLIPFLLNKWKEFSHGNVDYEIVEKLEEYDAVIATGSNNTAKYLEFYFKNSMSIIRKNRTSVAVLKGDESDAQLQLLAEDIFRYFGLGCRNVTRLFIPKEMKLDRLFENFMNFSEIINHNAYANNYDYNKAIYLLNQEKFWDNNFVMLKEDDSLFSPLSVLNFTRYESLDDVQQFLDEHEEQIQCVVANPDLGLNAENFGDAQKPGLSTHADNVDTMRFLEVV